MAGVLQTAPHGDDTLSQRLAFHQKLQAVTNKVHATSNTDELMVELAHEICDLFDADRLTIYVISEDTNSIVSKVKTGLNSFKDIKLPINDQSIAGFVAGHKRILNIRDVYDDAELKSYSPQLNFLKAVDTKTGYRTRQMPALLPLRSKYEALVSNAVLSSDELELAQRSARRKNLDLETVLVEEFQVKTPDLGNALSVYFAVPYEAFKADRVRPGD